jgi:hypothetical protein
VSKLPQSREGEALSHPVTLQLPLLAEPAILQRRIRERKII